MMAQNTLKLEPVASRPARRGLECRGCGRRDLRVLYTRATGDGALMRRRECRHCGRRSSTHEREIS
jgi:ribosomal protein S14